MTTRITKDQFDLLYHMVLDALVRITAVENLLMRKNITTDEEIQTEIVAISSAVISSVSSSLSETIDNEASGIQEVVKEQMSSLTVKKKDHSSN